MSSGFACTKSSAPQPRGNLCLRHYLIPGLLTHGIVFNGLRKEKTLVLLSSQNQGKREQRKNLKERLSKVPASCKRVAGLFTASHRLHLCIAPHSKPLKSFLLHFPFKISFCSMLTKHLISLGTASPSCWALNLCLYSANSYIPVFQPC